MGNGAGAHACGGVHRPHLADVSLVELVLGTAPDVRLYLQQTRAASAVLQDLSAHIVVAAKVSLVQG